MESVEVPVLSDDPSTIDALKSVSGPGVHRYSATLVAGAAHALEVHVLGMKLGHLDDVVSARYLPSVLKAYDDGREPRCTAILDLVDGASALTVELLPSLR